MKIEMNEFSFEESLKYLDELVTQFKEDADVPETHSMNEEELPLNQVVRMNCTAMSIKIINRLLARDRLIKYVYHAALSQIVSVLQSAKGLKHLDLQADGGLLALFDTPMKKDVEDIINLAAQVRSVNEVVVSKFRLDAGRQVVAVGIDYGPITVFSTDGMLRNAMCEGKPIIASKQLANVRDDSVNITGDIYANLPEEMRNNLFANYASIEDERYFYSPLINIRMHKWVVEQG